MQNKKINSPSTEELLRVAQELSLLLEDNNQTAKDCLTTLKEIQKAICPKPPSLFSRIKSKIINTK